MSQRSKAKDGTMAVSRASASRSPYAEPGRDRPVGRRIDDEVASEPARATGRLSRWVSMRSRLAFSCSCPMNNTPWLRPAAWKGSEVLVHHVVLALSLNVKKSTHGTS
jgi:hypothetical protein